MEVSGLVTKCCNLRSYAAPCLLTLLYLLFYLYFYLISIRMIYKCQKFNYISEIPGNTVLNSFISLLCARVSSRTIIGIQSIKILTSMKSSSMRVEIIGRRNYKIRPARLNSCTEFLINSFQRFLSLSINTHFNQ